MEALIRSGVGAVDVPSVVGLIIAGEVIKDLRSLGACQSRRAIALSILRRGRHTLVAGDMSYPTKRTSRLGCESRWHRG